MKLKLEERKRVFADELRDAMRRRGLRCREVAELVSCDLRTILRWRNGSVLPIQLNARKLFRGLRRMGFVENKLVAAWILAHADWMCHRNSTTLHVSRPDN